MRILVVTLALLVLSADAQQLDQLDPTAKADLPRGPASRRLVLTIATPPEAGDSAGLILSSNKIRVVLVTPDGRRISGENAEAFGFSWSETPLEPPIGSTDGGALLAIHFEKAAAAGDYVLELTTQTGSPAASAEARFISERKSYTAAMQQMKGYLKAGPVAAVNGGATLSLAVPQDEQGALFDVVVSDASAIVTLSLPDGRSIQSGRPNQAGIQWNILKNPSDIDPPEALLGISGFLLREAGTHHVVSFEKVARGTYKIQVGNSRQLTAAFIPVGRLLNEATADIGKLGDAQPGEVRLQPYALPYDSYVGDQLAVQVGFTGDPIAPQVNFEARLEYKDVIRGNSGGRVEYTTPVVSRAPVKMTRTSDGIWHGIVIPQRSGILRVGIHAVGKRANGKLFSADTLLTDVTVHGVVARFSSLTATAVDTDKNGTLDRLDITADLTVVVPGLYEMRLGLKDQGNGGLLDTVEKKLGSGAQRLTISVPSLRLRDSLKDGPWTIWGVQIFRPEGNTFGDFVATPSNLTVQTTAYKRDQWDKGPVWGEEHVEAHGLRPAASGRFRLVEVTWPIFSPGGECSWEGHFGMDSYGSLDTNADGKLKPGRATLSFVVDASMVAAAPKKDWHFSSLLRCGDATTSTSFIPLQLEPSQFEPGALLFNGSSQTMGYISPGGFGGGTVSFREKESKDVSFRVGDLPQGLRLTSPLNRIPGTLLLNMAAAADAKPGRYYIQIEGKSGTETATTEIVVDVVP